MGSECIDPCFLDLGSRWRWVVSFTPLPPYNRGKSPRCLLDRRLGLHDMEKWTFFTLPGALYRPAGSQSLPRLWLILVHIPNLKIQYTLPKFHFFTNINIILDLLTDAPSCFMLYMNLSAKIMTVYSRREGAGDFSILHNFEVLLTSYPIDYFDSFHGSEPVET
jgi:hypothetical protein